ncbi:MAG: 16S rRNA (uracil(1498)-N(3))-methyltransferase [Firmicutes bacterium]|nr:16S rRNA (uracil(1498)-N(3))-methyltransferase [Bacillota bacterium]
MKLKTIYATQYEGQELSVGDEVTVDGVEHGHAIRTFRLDDGDRCRIINGTDFWYEAEILTTKREFLTARILSVNEANTNPTRNLTVFQCMLKSDKMELLLQKLTEIGVSSFVPVMSRNVVKTGEMKEARANQIIVEALKQSGRTTKLELKKAIDFKQMAKDLKDFDCVFLANETATKKLGEFGAQIYATMKENARIGLIIGPEGGFDKSEIELLTNLVPQEKLINYLMCNQILRAETAAIAAASIILLG